MVYPNTFDKLHIGCSGCPVDLLPGGKDTCTTVRAIELCAGHGWDTMELAFVQNIHLKSSDTEAVAEASRRLAFPISCHGSYYINLASEEPHKIEASRARIVQAAERITAAGGHSVVFHSAFNTGRESAEVTAIVIEQLRMVEAELLARGVHVWLRPELTGKPVQHGDIGELIQLCNAVETVLPCIDWSHLHARTNGGFNSYDEWCEVLDRFATGVKDKNLLQRMHMHCSGIEYGDRGEKRHLPLLGSDLRYKELMAALKQAGVCGTMVIEAPSVSQLVDVNLFREAWDAA